MPDVHDGGMMGYGSNGEIEVMKAVLVVAMEGMDLVVEKVE